MHRAVLCWLALGDARAAVALYRQSGMYADAVMCARARLPAGDALLAQLYADWGEAVAFRQPELAARCFLAAGAHRRAVEVLTSRRTTESLRVAYVFYSSSSPPSS